MKKRLKGLHAAGRCTNADDREIKGTRCQLGVSRWQECEFVSHGRESLQKGLRGMTWRLCAPGASCTHRMFPGAPLA